MKAAGLYALFRFLFSGSNQEEKMSILVWLIVAAIETAIISVIVAAIAHGIDKKNDFGEWFGGSFVIVGIIQIIIGLITACS